jgi:alkaline phosphatase
MLLYCAITNTVIHDVLIVLTMIIQSKASKGASNNSDSTSSVRDSKAAARALAKKTKTDNSSSKHQDNPTPTANLVSLLQR